MAASIVVSGAIANKPFNGGEAWVRLHWILGLERLGFDVHFVERIDRAACVDASGGRAPFERSANLAWFRSVVAAFDLEGRATLVCEGGERWVGRDRRGLEELASEAALLVNITGHLDDPSLVRRFRRRAYVDVDPGFTQIWHASGRSSLGPVPHDAYFTVGGNVGRPGCAIPTGDTRWHPVRPPIVLDRWPVAGEDGDGRFTTIATWRSDYGAIEWGGRRFGLKHEQFRRVLELPRKVSGTFEIALDIHPGDRADRERLEGHGWRIVDPRTVAGDPASYRRYVQGSGMEFSVAQGVYVETNSGWLSDRSASYLASGRPVLVQDTGFGGDLPIGEGLLCFRTPGEAVAQARSLLADPERHRSSARAIAEAYFDSDRVLEKVLDVVGVAA